MIKAIALDDEPLALKVLQNFCASLEGIELERTFTVVSKATEYLSKNKVDLIFLDIQMPGKRGTDFAKDLESSPLVVFTTAYSEFAVEGFNLNAIDYLLKPFTRERFVQCIEKVNSYMENIALPGTSSVSSFIYLRSDYALVKVQLDQVLLIEGYDDYLKIHLLDQGPLVVRMTMKAILQMLPDKQFARVHRSFIIATRHLQKFNKNMVMVANREIPVGALYKDVLKGLI
jgi:DNA-binding LytR/AlgR family response regulator